MEASGVKMGIELVGKNSLPENLAPEWDRLLENIRFSNPFLTPLWSEIWMNHFGKSVEVKIILWRDSSLTLSGLGSFVPSSQNGKEGLSLLGSQDVWDYRDLIIESGKEEEAFSLLAKLFSEGPWQFIELRGISEFSPTKEFFPATMESSGFRVVEEIEETAVYLRLPSTWEEFLDGLSAKDRHELRRKMRRLERETSFTLSQVEDSFSLPEKLRAFFALHRKSRRDKAEFMNPEMESFFQEVASRFQRKGWLNLSFLEIAGQEAAAFFSFAFKGTEFVFNSGYDPQLGRLSPGIFLAAHCIRSAIEKGRERFNFMRGKEDYKYRLGGREEKIYRLRVEKR